MEERDLINLRHRDSRGFESLSLELAPAKPLFFMPWHVAVSPFCVYAQNNTGLPLCCQGIIAAAKCCGRSEEHTSELQSQSNLVCRPLLGKKKKREPAGPHPPPDARRAPGAPPQTKR